MCPQWDPTGAITLIADAAYWNAMPGPVTTAATPDHPAVLFFCDFKDYISKANDMTEKRKEKKRRQRKKNKPKKVRSVMFSHI